MALRSRATGTPSRKYVVEYLPECRFAARKVAHSLVRLLLCLHAGILLCGVALDP